MGCATSGNIKQKYNCNEHLGNQKTWVFLSVDNNQWFTQFPCREPSLLLFFHPFIFLVSLSLHYWKLPASTVKIVLFLGLIIGTGIVWIYSSSNALQFQFNTKNCFLVSLVLIGFIALNYRALNSVIPYLGDEGLHINRTLVLVTEIPLRLSLGVFVLFILLLYSAIKKPIWAIFIGMFIVMSVIFLFLDENPFKDIDQPLFVLPPILAGSNIFIREIFIQRRTIGVLLAFLTIFINLWISHVHLDGTKMPYWGNYLTDTSEHYYHYQDALVWIKNNDKNDCILFTGLDYPYSFQFYWNKLGWHPKRDSIPSADIDNETIAVTRILKKAERDKFDIVVYRVLGSDFLQSEETGPFRAKFIRNSAHVLIIYYKVP